MGITNATVNYTAAFTPYLPKIVSSAAATGILPISVCIDKWRLSLIVDEQQLILQPAIGTCLRCRGVPSFVSTFCVRPLSIPLVPSLWAASPICSISRYLAPTFSSTEEYQGLLWLVGNALVDPHSTSRFVILHGPGGTGKSSLLKCLRTVLRGVCQAVDMSSYVTARGTRMPTIIIESLVASRVVISGEVDFDSAPINSHFLKAITGNDPMPLPPFDATLNATTFVASNSLPRVDASTQWRSLSHARRVYVLPMTVVVARLA